MKNFRLLYLMLIGLAGGAAHAEALQFPGPGELQLKGYWYPAKQLPAPAIVLLHGCGGAYDKSGQVNARHAAMANHLNELGYSALLVDSFTPRAISEICTQKLSARAIRPADRAEDALAALDWLAARRDVEATHIGLLGWSNGGSTTLKTMQTQRDETKPHFVAAVAFYPGCKDFAKKPYQASAPLLILMGEADDWTPVSPCRDIVAQGRPATPALEMHTYPDTYHDFDSPALKTQRKRMEVPGGVHAGQGVTVAPNPEAAKDAWQRAGNWYAGVFGK